MKLNSILKKVVMAITGLALVGFLVTHLAGNLTLYMGASKMNAYAKFLEDQPFVIPAEFALLILFVIHLGSAFKLTMENKEARPVNNSVKKTAGQATLASRTMWPTGFIVLAFVVLHVWQFKFGTRPAESGLWGLVVNAFQQPLYVGIYVVAMLALGLHISHGIGSVFQSLGLLSNLRPSVRRFGAIAGWILALGFAALPLWVFLAKPQFKAPEPEKPAALTIPAALEKK